MVNQCPFKLCVSKMHVNEEYITIAHRLHPVQVEYVCYFCILNYWSAISCFM